MKTLNNTLRGQSLFELVMAIGVSAIIMVVLVALVNNALQSATYSRNQTQAARYAEAASEWLRSERDTDIAAFIANTLPSPTSWCLKDDPLNDASWNTHSACGTTKITGSNLFIRQVDFTTSTVSGKTVILATIAVSWTDSKGTHRTTSTTRFTDWRQR